LKGTIARLLIAAGIVFSLFIPFTSAHASPEITDVFLTNTAEDLIVYASLRDGFSEGLVEAIQSGVPTTFTFHLELYRNRNVWLDEPVSSRQAKHSVKYDLLRKEYRFTRDDSGAVEERTTKSLADLKSWMSELESVPLARYNTLIPNDRYYVRVKAEMKTTKLFFPLNYIFFFVSFLDEKTGWFESLPFTVKGLRNEHR